MTVDPPTEKETIVEQNDQDDVLSVDTVELMNAAFEAEEHRQKKKKSKKLLLKAESNL